MARRHLILALICWLGVGAASSVLSRGELRVGLWGGWATAGLAGAVTFAGLAWSLRRTLPALLQAVAAGFIVRLVLLVVGLFATVRGFGGSGLGFCAGFFAVYLPLQGIEVAVAAPRPSRPAEIGL